MTKMSENEVQCPNERNATTLEPLRLNKQGDSDFSLTFEEEEDEETGSKSLWSTLKKIFSKRSIS